MRSDVLIAISLRPLFPCLRAACASTWGLSASAGSAKATAAIVVIANVRNIEKYSSIKISLARNIEPGGPGFHVGPRREAKVFMATLPQTCTAPLRMSILAGRKLDAQIRSRPAHIPAALAVLNGYPPVEETTKMYHRYIFYSNHVHVSPFPTFKTPRSGARGWFYKGE